MHFKLVPDGKSLNSQLYTQQLSRIYQVLQQRYPALINRNQALLQHDGAPAHRSKKTKQDIEKLEGIELLPHPAYSPDLAPSDYYLFRSMASFLKGRWFDSVEDVEQGCQVYLLA